VAATSSPSLTVALVAAASSLSLTVAFALAASLLFGLSDFLGALASRTRSALQVTAFMQVSALAIMLPLAAARGSDGLMAGDIGLGVLGGLATALANVVFFAALGKGRVSLVVPVTAAVGAVVPASIGLLEGTALSTLTAAGAVCGVIAIPLVAYQRDEDRSGAEWPVARQLAAAAVAGAGFGLFYVLLSRTSEGSGLWPTVSTLVVAASITVAIALLRGMRDLRPPRVVVASGLLLGAAQACLTIALQRGPLTVASVLGSLYPLVTVVLGVIMFRERLRSWHSLGIALALAGVALIAAG